MLEQRSSNAAGESDLNKDINQRGVWEEIGHCGGKLSSVGRRN